MAALEEHSASKTWWTPNRTVAAIVALAFVVRLWAASQLPLDFDEPVYLEAAYDYARAIQSGDLDAVIDYRGNIEHPPLVKILYGLVIAAMGGDPEFSDALFVTRILSAIFGTLAVWLLALVHPLAGAMLAVHTLVVKYTSQTYLEALPHLTSLAAVLAFLRFSRIKSLNDTALPSSKWFWISAIALGITAAGKYTYLPLTFVILFLAFQLTRRGFPLQKLLPYAAVAAVVFWLFNPFLWRDPSGRLMESLLFHPTYAQSEHVEASGYGWYQPLIWIAHSVGFQFHPDVFIYFGFDGLIFLLAAAGMLYEWRQRRWVVFWVIAALLFLLIWPTKWPQYTMIVIPALCLAGSAMAQRLYQLAAEYEDYYGTLKELFPRPPRIFWIMIGAIMMFLMVAFVANSISVARSRIGWSQISSSNSFLPAGAVYRLLPGPEGQMILGTERGLVIWTPPAASDLPDTWVIYNTGNSGLAHNRVLALLRDPDGVLWIGTQSGLNRFDGQEWRTFRAEEMGLSGDQIHSLAAGSDRRIWAATSTGAAVYDGTSWQAFTTVSGLVHDAVFAVAVEADLNGDRVWFGTLEGVSSYDTSTASWQSFSRADLSDFGGGIAAFLIDSQGRLWMGSRGGGLYWLDGAIWQVYRTGNSDIPHNTIEAITEYPNGTIWVGVSVPTTVGGVVASLQDGLWTTFSPRNSGYSGGEPISLAFDTNGRLWIGTRTAGVDIYQFAR